MVLDAFWELSTERQMGMSIGPIPLSQAHAAADRLGLDNENHGAFIHAIREMDRLYLKHVNKKSEA